MAGETTKADYVRVVGFVPKKLRNEFRMKLMVEDKTLSEVLAELMKQYIEQKD